MKKTLLIITKTSGGLYLFRRELIKKLSLDYCIYVITSDTGRLEELRNLGCEIILSPIDRRGKNVLKDLNLFLTYIQNINDLKPSLIITYTIKPNIYGGIAARIMHIPYAANITGLGSGFQSSILRCLLSNMYRVALRKAKVVFCENSSIKDVLKKYKIVQENKVVVLQGAGVNLDYFSYHIYPTGNKCFNFLFVGRVMKEKGIDELLDALAKLIAEGIDCKLTVVGSLSKEYLNISSLYSWIDYKGFQKDVRPFIYSADCFVLPSYHEGMANTNLECAASGRPIITSNIPGCKEAVVDGITGYLCETKNVDSLYKAMKKIVNLTCEERRTMGIAGREYMESDFDKVKVIEQTISYIK